MHVVLSARVSSEEQNQGEAVSISQQLADMRTLCARNGWQVMAEYVDDRDYIATQQPKKGKTVNPSGERADRPGLLALLERVKSGEPDAIVCWRDDRLVRHPRVAVVLEDALDQADAKRNGRGKVQIFDATGATVDRFVLGIKAVLWREENKRRVDRTVMGKVGTLQAGRWPGHFEKLGYTTVKEPGRRGRLVILEESEARIVKMIFDLYDAGVSVRDIRERLIQTGAGQKGDKKRWRDWARPIIMRLLRDEEYTGKAVFGFADGTTHAIDIPAIVSHEQWERCQERIDRNKRLSTRNAGDVYLLQGIAKCACCEGSIGALKVRYYYKRQPDGTLKRFELGEPTYQYRCHLAAEYPDSEHTSPSHWSGEALDWTVWRKLVDGGIRQPDAIRDQVLAKQARLQAEGDDIGGEIDHAAKKLEEIEGERAFYLKQAGRGKITEAEFDAQMAETAEARDYWHGEIKRLRELRDNAAKVSAGLEYATRLLESVQTLLPGIDQTPEELRTLPEERRRYILTKRQEIVRSLVDEVKVYASGDVKIYGCFDGDEMQELDLQASRRW